MSVGIVGRRAGGYSRSGASVVTVPPAKQIRIVFDPKWAADSASGWHLNSESPLPAEYHKPNGEQNEQSGAVTERD